jgi:hypothetical protein
VKDIDNENYKIFMMLGVVTHTYNNSIQEAEAGRLQVQIQSGLLTSLRPA